MKKENTKTRLEIINELRQYTLPRHYQIIIHWSTKSLSRLLDWYKTNNYKLAKTGFQIGIIGLMVIAGPHEKRPEGLKRVMTFKSI